MTADSRPNIFVVDDEPTISSTLTAILNSSGFSATGFMNPLEALRSAETQCPDFLISDVVMPQLNGIDLGVQFKAMHPKCRILLFSGQATSSPSIEEARKRGHNFNLLSKPIHPQDLLAALEALGQRA